MSENNNPKRTLSDVALERVMRDVLGGLWEPLPHSGNGHQSDTACPSPELPDEDGESAY
ncbi:MAG: hypothetical protein P8178_01110 [Candidatus Thiodiazotropha sp.]